MIYFLSIGWSLNIITGLILTLSDIRNGMDITLSDLLKLLILSIIPYLIPILSINYDKVILKGKRK